MPGMPLPLCLVTVIIASVLPLLAQLRFTHSLIPYEVKPEEEQITVSFPFTATEDTTVIAYHSPCGCLTHNITRSDWKKHEQGALQLTLDTTKLKGTARKSLELQYENLPPQTITIEARLPTLFTCTPQTLQWNGQEPATPKEIILTIHPGADFTIQDVTALRPGFQLQLSAPQQSAPDSTRTYKLTVTPDADITEKTMSLLLVKTTSEIPRYKTTKLLAIKAKQSQL